VQRGQVLVRGGCGVALGELSADRRGVLVAQRGPRQGEGVTPALGEEACDRVQSAAQDLPRSGRAQARQVDRGRVLVQVDDRCRAEGEGLTPREGRVRQGVSSGCFRQLPFA